MGVSAGFTLGYLTQPKRIPLHRISPFSFLLQRGVLLVWQLEQMRSSEGLPSFLKGGKGFGFDWEGLSKYSQEQQRALPSEERRQKGERSAPQLKQDRTGLGEEGPDGFRSG